MLNVLLSLYVVLALFFASLTWRERRFAGGAPLRPLGLLLCAVWPLALMLFASARALRRT